MTKKNPYFSIIIPTRDRPQYLQVCLKSIIEQTFQDYEVIIADNYTKKTNKNIVDAFNDERFTHIVPPQSLSMHENWEFGLKHVRGEYILILIDKTLLYRKALETAYNVSKQMKVEIITWWPDSFRPKNEETSVEIGTFIPCSLPTSEPHRYSLDNELKTLFNLTTPRGKEGCHYYRGKICFGAYHKDLIKKINDRVGGIFYPISPDYTSMLSALSLGKSAVDINRPLMIQMITKISNGYNTLFHPECTNKFLSDIGNIEEIHQKLPIPYAYASQHNIVIYDYITMKERLGKDFPNISLNMENLYLLAWRDICALHEDKMTIQYHKSILLKELAKLKISSKARIYIRIVNLKIHTDVENLIKKVKVFFIKHFFLKSLSFLPKNIKCVGTSYLCSNTNMSRLELQKFIDLVGILPLLKLTLTKSIVTPDMATYLNDSNNIFDILRE